MDGGKPSSSSQGWLAQQPGVSSRPPRRPRLNELPFHIQEDIWRSVFRDLQPQVLFLELDGLRGVPRKPYRDTASDVYKNVEEYLETADPEVRLANVEKANSRTTRRALRASTKMVRFFGSLCTNSRRATIEAFPHTVGLGFAKRSNKKEDASPRNSILRFNGDRDLCVISAGWEQQIHYLRNKDGIAPSVRLIKNWGLSLETLWNDRVLQKVHFRLAADPMDAWQYPARYCELPPTRPATLWPPEPNFQGGPLGVYWDDWSDSCGCLAPGARRENCDWNPRAWGQRDRPPICSYVCKREPLPTFIGSLPNIGTLVLVSTDHPVILSPRVPKEYVAILSSISSSTVSSPDITFGLSLVEGGRDSYILGELPGDLRHPQPRTLYSIRQHWRSGFPYTQCTPNVRVRLLRRIIMGRTSNRLATDSTRETDVPYIFEARIPGIFQAETPGRSRERQREPSNFIDWNALSLDALRRHRELRRNRKKQKLEQLGGEDGD